LRYLEEGAQNVGAQPFGRFVRHLHAILENADREMLDWVTRQPQPEVRMHRFPREALAYLSRSERKAEIVVTRERIEEREKRLSKERSLQESRKKAFQHC